MPTEYFEKIIYYLLQSKYLNEFIIKDCIRFIYDEDFKGFIETIIDFFREFSKIPAIDEYEKYIRQNHKYIKFTTLFQKFSIKQPIENYEFILKQITNEYINQRFTSVINNVDYKNIDLLDVSTSLSKIIADMDIVEQAHEQYVWEGVKERYNEFKNGGEKAGISSGFSTFDKAMGGLNKKELYLYFARTGGGKSLILFNHAYNLAAQGKHVIYFSLEMYMKQMLRIFDSRDSAIPIENIKYARADKLLYKQALLKIQSDKYPLWIAEKPNGNADYILSKIREYKKKNPLDAVIIDYLGIMKSGLKGIDRDEEYGERARILKNLAKMEDLIVMTAVQTNRQVVNSEDIIIEHIGDSNKIAQYCDFVAYVSRAKIAEDKLMDIKVLKQRDGISNINLKFATDFATRTMKDEIQIAGHDNKEKINDDNNYNKYKSSRLII
jgi:replicative DNA helicase